MNAIVMALEGVILNQEYAVRILLDTLCILQKI